MKDFRTHARQRQRAGDRGGGEGENRATRRGHSLHRRRHDADRFDEAQRRDADRNCRHQSTAARARSKRSAGWRPDDRCDGAQFGPRAIIRWCKKIIAVLVGSDLERRDRASCATWPRPAAICCNERAACISETPRCRATNASLDPVAPRSLASIASLAILGTSEHCIATNPSDMNVALAALEATIHHARAERRAQHSDRGLPSACPETRRNVRPFWSRAI